MTRKALGGLIAVMAMVVAWLVVRGWHAGPSLDRSRSAYDRGNWSRSASIAGRWLDLHPDDSNAILLRARGLARLGGGREALSLFARVEGERLGAEDLFLIGRVLLREGRTVLGLAALDAALKIDPKHREAVEALAGERFHAGNSGADLGRVDRLATVPSGPGLAVLVVGLAMVDGLVGPHGENGAALTRVLRRDRSTFLAIDGPTAARKMLARTLLEDGRAAEARSWLERVEDRSDPEVNWLLSRAFLVEGKLELACAAAASAGTYGREDPTRPEPSRFVGAKRCAECHGAIYRSQQGSRHAATFATGEAMKALPLPRGPVADPGVPGVVHRFERSGGRIRASAEVEGRLYHALVDYALGSGRHGITMIAREESGRRRSLRISYYAGGDHWGLTSGFEPHPGDAEAFLGEPLAEESFVNCLNCHTTRFTSESDRDGPEAADRGIGCERCHGPADHHLRAVELGFPDLAIARPKVATPALRLRLCTQCHGADGIIPPSDPRFIRFQGANLPYSRCVTESRGRLDCVACHDPHGEIETDHAYYEARCLACHGGGGGKLHRGNLAGLRVETVAASRCPVNASADCVRCHMPRVEQVMPFTGFTDHHIRIHKTAGASESDGARPPH